jgi:hypothetical protein
MPTDGLADNSRNIWNNPKDLLGGVLSWQLLDQRPPLVLSSDEAQPLQSIAISKLLPH